jgi:hypothetical protein
MNAEHRAAAPAQYPAGRLLHVRQRSLQEVLAGLGYCDDFDCAPGAACNARRTRHVIHEAIIYGGNRCPILCRQTRPGLLMVDGAGDSFRGGDPDV